MHGLSSEIDLTFLRGREVGQIAIGMHQVIFAFDEGVTISVESEFTYSAAKEDSIWKPGAPHIAANTLSLLGAKVESVENRGDGTLVLVFSNRARLIIPDSSADFESYQIVRPGQTIVV